MFHGVSLVAGPARSGKTHRLLAAYREALARGPLGAALWLCPTHRAAAEVRRQLLDGTLSGCFAPQCLTFDQFARRILDASELPIRPLGPSLARQILKGLLDESARRGELEYFGPIAHTRGFLDLVVAFIQELKRLEIWPQELAQACGTRRARKDHELCQIYERYQQLLTEHHLYDAQGRFWSARAQLRDGQRRPFESLRHVFVDGFTDFTRTEHEILEILAGWVDSLTVSLPLEDGPRRSELFAKCSNTVEQLRRRHPQIVVERAPRRATAWPAMDHLERQLFANPRELPPAPDPLGIEILPAAGASQEIELLACRIKELLVRGEPDGPIKSPSENRLGEGDSPILLRGLRKIGTVPAGSRMGFNPVPPGEILVVFRSLADVGDLVREAFGQFGVPVAIGSRPTLGRAPVMSALLAWLRLDLEDWPFRQVLRVLAHNLFRPDWPEWAQGQAALALERLVHQFQIPSGRAALAAGVERWARRASTDEEVPRAERHAALAAEAKLALPLLARMASTLDDLPERATLGDWSAAITRLVQATGLLAGPEEADDSRGGFSSQAAWQQLVAALRARDDLSRLLGQQPVPVSRREFYDELRELLHFESATVAEDEAGRVRVVSAESARGLSAPYVFVAGLSEKAFPPPFRDDCLHSEAETRELVAAGLPLVPHSQRRGYEMLLFYEIVTRATRRLVLSYPALDQAAQPLAPSPYVTEVEHIFAPRRVTRGAAVELSGVPPTDDVFSPRDFRVRAVARALEGDSAMLGELHRHPATSIAADNILAGLQVSVARRRGESFGPFEGMLSEAARPVLLARYGPDRCWSPSQLEQYARCPYQFFLASVLSIEPLDEPRLAVDYLGRGRMLHAVLSAAHRRLNEQAGRPSSPGEQPEEQFRGVVDELLRAQVERMLGDHALADGLLEIDARRVAAWLSGYFAQHDAYDAAWRECSEPLRPAHFEVAFGPVGRGAQGAGDAEAVDELSTAEPFVLECGSKTFRFSGRIDRIDIGQVGDQTVFNIVDYKSGRPSAGTSMQSVLEGYSLQLPLYALAAGRLLADRGALPFRAAYWHVSAQGYKEKDAIKFHIDAEGRLEAHPDWQSLQARLRDRVRSLVQGIRRGEFPMHSVDEDCTSRCAYSTVCRVAQARRLNKAWQPPGEESP